MNETICTICGGKGYVKTKPTTKQRFLIYCTIIFVGVPIFIALINIFGPISIVIIFPVILFLWLGIETMILPELITYIIFRKRKCPKCNN